MPNLNVGLGAAMPAFATNSESFPSNGLMLENKTYSNAATYDNVGAYSGFVRARAEYVNTLQQIIGGTYLPAGAMVAEQCPANSYCPGVTDATINASESQGISSCPSGYPNSDVGASSNTQCYTACTLNSANIEHATAVSGNDYYGDGTDTCFATKCENGYSLNGTVKVIEQRPLIDVDLTVSADIIGFVNTNGQGEGQYTDFGLTEKNTWAAGFDYGVVYGRASCQPKLHDTSLDYINANYNAIVGGTMSLDQLRSVLTNIAGSIKANYVADLYAGFLDGTISEEDFSGRLFALFSMPKDASFSTTDTGEYCDCQITGFQSAPSDESDYYYGYFDISRAVAIESAPWVMLGATSSESECADTCAEMCASVMGDTDVFRKVLFGAFRVTDASTCEVNEITIEWTDAAEEDIAANNAGMCTYGGDIRTPIKAATKPGKTFIGWKFLPQEQPK